MLCHIVILATLTWSAVHAQSGPILVEQPEDTIYDVNSNLGQVVLNCRAEGSSPLTYSWRLNGTYISQATNSRVVIGGGQLTIQNPDRASDLGEYVCEASNSVGKVRSLPADLRFAYVDPFEGDDSATTLFEDEGSCLSCNPSDYYPAILTNWYKDLIPLNTGTDERIRVMDDSRLCFAYVQQSDEGSYQCYVKSNLDTPYSSAFTLSPFIQVSVNTGGNPDTSIYIDQKNKPKSITAQVGEDISFECFFFGKKSDGQPPTIQWQRTAPSGAAMPTGASSSDNGEVLQIRGVRMEDAGTYWCYSESANNGAEADLTVVEPPSWVARPYSTQKDIYTDFTWTVEATSSTPGDITYKWYRNGEHITSLDRHVFTENYRRLTISHLVVADTAMYQCFASNSYGTIYSSAQLTVRAFPPSFDGRMELDQPAPRRSKVTVICPVDGAPFPTITWSHEGEPITHSAHFNLEADPPNLVIDGVLDSDGGEYECYAENEYGSEAQVGSIVVKVETVINTAPENLEVEVGGSVTLRCEAEHDPSLEIAYVWIHNEMEIDLRGSAGRFRMIKDGNLEITNVEMQDAGNYTCRAMTVADSAYQTGSLTVMGPPGPPAGLTVTIEPNMAALLSWSRGSDNGSPITSFVVEGHTNHDNTWVELREEAGEGTNSVRLTGLEPFSQYTFRVYAVNKIGSGGPSEPTTATELTDKAAPSESPANVGGGGGNVGDLRITWDVYPESMWNSDMVKYNVEWKRVNTQETSPGTIEDPDATVYVATENINLYTMYEVRVQAENDVGTGPFSEWTNIYSYQEAPHVAPTEVSARPMSASSIEVSWNAIDPSGFQGELEGYKLLYWQQDSDRNNANTAISAGTGTTATIPSLAANTQYSIVALAYSGGGNGPESAIVQETTYKTAPQQKPGNVELSVSGADVTVEWSAITTSSSEENLQGYKIRFRKQGVFEEDADTVVAQGAGTTKATLRDLALDTTYIITVQGYSAGGSGASSDPLSITTANAKTGQSSDGGPGGDAPTTAKALSLSLLFLITLLHSFLL